MKGLVAINTPTNIYIAEELNKGMEQQQIITISQIEKIIMNEIKDLIRLSKKETNDWMIAVGNDGYQAIEKLEELGFYVIKRELHKQTGRVGDVTGIPATFIPARFAHFYLKVPATQTGQYELEEGTLG